MMTPEERAQLAEDIRADMAARPDYWDSIGGYLVPDSFDRFPSDYRAFILRGFSDTAIDAFPERHEQRRYAKEFDL